MSKAKSPTNEEKGPAPYEPDARERAALGRHQARIKTAPPLPEFKSVNGGLDFKQEPEIGWDLLQESFGTASGSFAGAVLAQLIGALSPSNSKGIDHIAINGAIAAISSVQPRDELETMLAAQMAAVHHATMDFAKRLNRAENIKQQESAERTFNKLARTFCVQLEALKRYRGGEQKITVQHVTVNDGGQAIVGTVERGQGLGEG